jgi:anthranilate/para-aminobenzoate synthase component II
MPDPLRIKAILNYPAPKNQKQLRRFLGVCGSHQRFIINYASYVVPLLVLLQKKSKWRCSAEMQSAFEKLREKFARSIHLIHPDDSLPYTIHTDASGRAVAAVLMQVKEDGKTRIVSTIPRVLMPVEQRYSTCEQELFRNSGFMFLDIR